MRSAQVHRLPDLRIDQRIELAEPDAVPSLLLPASADFGFARLTRTGDNWMLAEGYTINLEYAEPTPIEEGTSPVRYVLNQNYPNPFRSKTVIRFTLPESGYIVLRVYDALGRSVMTLAEGHYAAGDYDMPLDGGHLPSGVYMYRLEAGGQFFTRRMVLAR